MFFGKLVYTRAPKNPTKNLKIIDWPKANGGTMQPV